jgi:hypothetical protein
MKLLSCGPISHRSRAARATPKAERDQTRDYSGKAQRYEKRVRIHFDGVEQANSGPTFSSRFFRPLNTSTTTHKITQRPAATIISIAFGEKIKMNPFPFTKAEKLETQNGIKNNRNVCQKSNRTLFALAAVVLMNNAKPMIKLNPSEVSQSLSERSK